MQDIDVARQDQQRQQKAVPLTAQAANTDSRSKRRALRAAAAAEASYLMSVRAR